MSTARDNASLWSKLTPEQRDELMFALVDSRCGAEAGAALAKTWNVSTSKSAVHRFYEAERSNWTIERAKRFATETFGMLPEELETAQRNVVRQKAFELASSSELSAKELLKLRDQEIKLIMLQQSDRKLKILEAKFNEANAVMDDEQLSEEEQLNKMRAIFGR